MSLVLLQQASSWLWSSSSPTATEDFNRRMRFSNLFVENMTAADMWNIVYSDEATLSLDGEVNTQNIRKFLFLAGMPPKFITLVKLQLIH